MYFDKYKIYTIYKLHIIKFNKRLLFHSKKTRTARASHLQLTKMIDYFYLNKGLAEGKFNALHGKEKLRKSGQN